MLIFAVFSLNLLSKYSFSSALLFAALTSIMLLGEPSIFVPSALLIPIFGLIESEEITVTVF